MVVYIKLLKTGFRYRVPPPYGVHCVEQLRWGFMGFMGFMGLLGLLGLLGFMRLVYGCNVYPCLQDNRGAYISLP